MLLHHVARVLVARPGAQSAPAVLLAGFGPPDSHVAVSFILCGRRGRDFGLPPLDEQIAASVVMVRRVSFRDPREYCPRLPSSRRPWAEPSPLRDPLNVSGYRLLLGHNGFRVFFRISLPPSGEDDEPLHAARERPKPTATPQRQHNATARTAYASPRGLRALLKAPSCLVWSAVCLAFLSAVHLTH